MDLLNQHNILKYTRTGQMDYLLETLNSGVDVNYLSRHNHIKFYDKGFTALMIACETGNNDAIKLLLRYKADINLQSPVSAHRLSTALMVAVSARQAGCVRSLLANGADINCQDAWGETALMIAIKQNSGLEIIEPLVVHSSFQCDLKNWQGKTAYDLMFEQKHLTDAAKK